MTQEKPVRKRVPQESIARIIAAASQEFAEHGLNGASIDNIARRCGRTKQLIYHYYGSKEELFSEVVIGTLKQSISNMLCDDYDKLDPTKAVECFLCNLGEQYRQFPERASIMLDENIHFGVHFRDRHKVQTITRPVQEIFAGILRRGADEGVFVQGLEPEKLFVAAFSLMTVCFLNGRVLSTFLPIDLQTEEGVENWLSYAVGLFLKIIMVNAPGERGLPAPLGLFETTEPL